MSDNNCTQCQQKFARRHKSPYLLVCSNNCFNWFHNIDCFHQYLLNKSDLANIPEGKDIHGPQLSFEQIKEIAKKIKKTKSITCQCGGNLIGAKKLINIDPLRPKRFGNSTHSDNVYELFIKNKTQWEITLKKYIRKMFNEYIDNIKWLFFSTEPVHNNYTKTRNYRMYAKYLLVLDTRIRTHQKTIYYASRLNELKTVNEVKEQMIELNKLFEI
jgi:hypothetical protein